MLNTSASLTTMLFRAIATVLLSLFLVISFLFSQNVLAEVEMKPATKSLQTAYRTDSVQLPVNTQSTPIEEEYLIGPKDLIDIDVFQVKDLSLTVRVSSQGLISLPLVGNIKTAGLSTQSLEQVLALKLGENLLQNPQVSVFIKEYASQKVTLEGGVNKPGVYSLSGRTTLLQAIAMANGFVDLADTGNVQIFRTLEKGDKRTLSYDVSDIRRGKAPDPYVKAHDIIVVRKSTVKSFIKGVTDTLRGFVSFGRID